MPRRTNPSTRLVTIGYTLEETNAVVTVDMLTNDCYLGVFSVTQAQHVRVVGSNPANLALADGFTFWYHIHERY